VAHSLARLAIDSESIADAARTSMTYGSLAVPVSSTEYRRRAGGKIDSETRFKLVRWYVRGELT